MESAYRHVMGHLRDLGLGTLSAALAQCMRCALDRAPWPELAVLQAAEAAELLLKARIAEEHPLLLFRTMPPMPRRGVPVRDLQSFFEEGETHGYSDLPEHLWATTGIELPGVDRYRAFGRLARSIKHRPPTSGFDAIQEVLRFVFEVLDPFLEAGWGFVAMDFFEDSDRTPDLLGLLLQRRVAFLMSPHTVRLWHSSGVELSMLPEDYRRVMRQRLAAASGPARV